MRLYEINAAIAALIDPETGDVMDYEAFACLQMARTEKIENMAFVVKNAEATSKAFKDEIKKLEERKKVADNTAKRVREYISRELDGEAFSTARCEVRFKKTPASLEINDARVLATWLEEIRLTDLVTYEAPRVDKNEVKKLVNAKIAVPGCALVSGVSMTVR